MALKALIIDDSQTCQEILSKLLQQHNFSVDSAIDGEKGLNRLDHSTPDIIFLDHTLPDKSGFEVLELLRSRSDTEHLPIVMYTAQNSDEYRDKALQKGASAVLVKNTQGTTLTHILQSLTSYQPPNKQPATPASSTPSGQASLAATKPASTSSAGPKPVASYASIPKEQPSSKHQAAQIKQQQINDIFNRAKQDHASFRLDALQESAAKHIKIMYGSLLMLALPLLWLFASALFSSHPSKSQQQTNNISADYSTDISRLKQQIKKLSAQLDEQRAFSNALQQSQLQLNSNQQQINQRISATKNLANSLSISDYDLPHENTIQEISPDVGTDIRIKQTVRSVIDNIDDSEVMLDGEGP